MSENTAQYMTGDMSQEVKITDMTVIELKAAAFDLIAQRDNLQATINAIVAELQKRERVV